MDKQAEILVFAKPVGQPPDAIERQAILVRQLAKIVIPALRSASPIHQQQVAHIPIPSAASRVPAAMRPDFRRGWVGEGKAESSPWRGPAGKARHTGATIALWERKGKALGVPAQAGKELK
jgi:hypothetical protein